MAAIATHIRGPLSIATYTWREGMRKKTLIGFLILSILVILGSQFMTAFLTETQIGAEGGATDVDLKLIKDICVTAISIFGVLITIFISASVVPNEVENKVVYTVLSKPIGRFQYLFGKFLGVQLIIIANLVLMGFLFSLALYVKQPIFPTLLLYSIFLTYFEFLIISAFTFAISCTSTSAVLPTIAGLFIYITGNLIEYLKFVANRAERMAGESISMFSFDHIVGIIAKYLHQSLPNLQHFSLKTQILHLQINDVPKDVQIPWLVAYGLAYAVAGFLISYWVFRRKEL